MKTNKDDIRSLKSKHRLELVMKETGESFEVDTQDKDLWRSTSTPGLTVDLRRQMYEIKQLGESESGDVIAWLKRRYSWTFGMVIKFLQKRSPDPKKQELPQPESARNESQTVHNIEDKTKPLDHWQEKALEISGERIRNYFSWSWWDLITYIEETRIEPIHALGVTRCTRCEKHLEWLVEAEQSLVEIPQAHGYKLKHIGQIPTIAYSIKRRLKISDLRLKGSGKLEDAFSQLIDELGALFVEDENGIVCAECAWDEYDFQIALELCKTSAQMREQIGDEQRRKHERKAWLDAERERIAAEDRLSSEAALP